MITSSRVIAILEWYFDTRCNPSMGSCLAGMPATDCLECGAEVGQMHRSTCSQAGTLNAGGQRPRKSSPDPETATLRRQAAIGAALARLGRGREAVVVEAFIVRRAAQDVSAVATNHAAQRGRWLSHRLGEYAHAQRRKAELRAIASDHWRRWRNITRRRAYRDALTRLMSEATRGAIW